MVLPRGREPSHKRKRNMQYRKILIVMMLSILLMTNCSFTNDGNSSKLNAESSSEKSRALQEIKYLESQKAAREKAGELLGSV